MSETVEQFLARGGQVQRIPLGQCNWDALSNRAKINPQVREDERGPRQAMKAALPAPKKAERNGFSINRPGKKKAPPRERKPRKPQKLRSEARETLDLLPMHPTVPMLVAATGKSRKVVWLMLDRLRKKGWVESKGVPCSLNTWHVTANAPDR